MPDFKASWGWLEKFRKHQCNCLQNISREATDVNAVDVGNFPSFIILMRYLLFYRALSEKNMSFDDTANNYKLSSRF